MSDPFDVSLRVRLNYEAGGAAKSALSDVEAIRAGAAKLGQSVGTISGDGFNTLSAGAIAARRAMAETAEAASRLATTAGPAAATAEIGRMRAEAATAGRAVDALGDKLGTALKVQRAAGGFKNGAELEAFLKTFDAQVKSADRAVGTLSGAAGKLSASVGPGRLAEGMAGISPAAVEARRHIDDVGTAARTAQRELERMGAAGRAAGGGAGGGGGSAGGGSAGHGPGGGMRGALIAGARPLHMERLVMSAMTPVGLAGLGAGLGLEKVVHGLASAEEKAIALESAMLEVRRAAGDMPSAGVKHLEGSILDVSRATGAASTELAGVAAAALRAGKPVEELPGFMDRAAKVANVMGFSVGEAGDKLIGLSRAWKEDRAGVEDTTDAVALLAQRTGAKAGGVLDFVDRFSDMRERHMSARQVAGFGAGFQASGLDPSQASSAFGALSEKLAMPQKAGPEFEQRLFNLGIGPTQARQGMRDDPTRMMMQVLEKLKQLPDEHRANVLEQMFGPEGGRDIGRVVEHLDALKRSLGLVEDAAARHGALEKSFKLFDDTTRAKIDRASAAMGAFAAKVGQEMAPAVGKAAEATERLFNAMSNVLDRTDRNALAGEILDAKRAARSLSEDQKAAIAADPKLKAMTGAPEDKLPGLAPSLVPQPPVPRSGAQPELTDPEVAAARDRARQGLEGRVRELEAQKAVGAGGPDVARQIEAARRKLDAFDRSLAPAPNPAGGGTARPSRDQHGSMIDPSMVHRASYVEGDDDRRSGGGSPTDALRAVMAAATKDGVVAGLREFALMGGTAAGGIVKASWETGDAGSGGSAGFGGSGSAGGGWHDRSMPSMRYGRAHAGASAGGGAYDVGGHASAMAGDVAQRAGRATSKLEGLGWSHEAAAIAAGNAQQESSIRSDGPLGDTKRFGTGDDAAHGLFQWRGQRFRDLKSFAADKGKAWTDFDSQVEFFDHESRKYGSGDWRHSKDMVEANRGMKRFEGYGDDSFGTRLANGRQILAGRTSGGFYPAQGGPAGSAEGGAASRAVDLAGKLDGMTSGQAGGALGARMTPGEWCADFVNGALKAAGVKGSGSSMAMSFQNWGKHVGFDGVKRGDVIVENHGRGQGHAGLATGAVKRDANGKVVAIGMTSGNHGDKVVKDYWEKVGNITDLRRADEEVARAERATTEAAHRGAPLSSREAAREAARQGLKKGDTASPRFSDRKSLSVRANPTDIGGPGAGAGARQVAQGPAPIQNFYGMHDPAQTARMAMLENNREVRRTQARALHSLGRVA